jgi:small conductance mechanosensitive channel
VQNHGINKCLMVLVCSLFMVISTANAAGIDFSASPIGASSIDVKELSFRIAPLDKTELSELADYWLHSLKNHLLNMSEIQVKIEKTKGTQKEKYLQELNEMLPQKQLLIDKVNLILVELQEKGGDITEYESYIASVSGGKVDLSDTNAAFSVAIGWLKSSEGGIRWVINIALFLITLLVFKILAKVLSRITEKSVSRLKGASDLLKHFFVSLVKKLTLLIGFMIALSMLEINIAPLLAALGAVGFIIGFALQGTLSNFASGIMILIYRPYDLGDVVIADGITGTVNAMTMVSTSLKLPDNQVVIIPNNAIWGNTIINITGSETRRVDMVFGIGYDDDMAKAEKVLMAILQEHPLVLDDPEPIIKVHELADSSVNFIVRPWVKTADYFTVFWDVTRAVKERFDAEAISIPYPQHDVHLHTEIASG